MNHLTTTDEAVEYLKQFAWVKDWDNAFNVMFPVKNEPITIDEESDDENENV